MPAPTSSSKVKPPGANPPAVTPTPALPKTGDRWIPRRSTAWQWQLSGPLDLSVDVPIYNVDGATTTAAQVAELHKQGRRVICYVNAGAARQGDGYQESLMGKALKDWPDERWLDIRRLDAIKPVLTRQIAVCRRKGFDAVEPDNVDGYANESGFALTAADQLRFNRWIADVVHQHGMSVGLKNDLAQVAELEPSFDFAVNEQCAQYGECAKLVPFVQAGKAVLHVEYELAPGKFCAQTRVFGFSSMRKPHDLGPARQPC
ncbi:hypothetical protein FB561_1247 [Kribbella amoyensis]|uniref:Glycoside-hydrolase family GH114 TIM-barrel domain-containing protein n=1 Tax=Kribbella amoyensis TaxID=996641 RepID=A0A561BMV6_9ACTN|nr:endo alpha-1,4 polygalactosaminidase [Kribbella amoyensis]TWD80174.1 hypothetical protein FB561_1247 [Kribbella amoyensis]